MSEHSQLCDLIANLIAEQQKTTAAVVSLAEAIANAGSKSAKKQTAQAIETAQNAAKYAEQKAKIAEPVQEVEQVAAPVSETTALEYADVASKITAVVSSKGKDVAIGILAKFGAKTLQGANVEDFPAIVTECEKALA